MWAWLVLRVGLGGWGLKGWGLERNGRGGRGLRQGVEPMCPKGVGPRGRRGLKQQRGQWTNGVGVWAGLKLGVEPEGVGLKQGVGHNVGVASKEGVAM